MRRLAQLIGVRNYEGIRELPQVEGDLARMRSALEGSDYHVLPDLLGCTERRVAPQDIYRAVRSACQRADPGDLLLLYFSGHGLYYRGEHYLLSSDARLEYIEDIGREGQPLGDFQEVFDRSAARAILFIVDTCREGVGPEDTKAAPRAWLPWQVRLAQKPVGILFSCEPGAFSRVIDGEGGISLFTDAFTRVLHPSFGASRWSEIVVQTTRVLKGLCELHEKTVQVPRQEGRLDGLDAVEVCYRPQPATVDWRAAARDTAVWSRVAADAKEGIQELREALMDWLDATLQVGVAGEWTDRTFSSRILDQVAFILRVMAPDLWLSPAEAALLVAVPLIRGALPPPSRTEVAEDDRVHLPASSSQQADRLLDWFRVRAHSEGQSWTAPPAPEHRILKQVLDPAIVARLLSTLSTNLGGLDREEEVGRWCQQHTVSPGRVDEQRIRERLLAHVLALAGRMAIDVGTLSSVIGEHITTGDPVLPKDALDAVRDITWAASGPRRDLQTTCRHHVVDLALLDHVAASDRFLQVVHVRVAMGTGQLAALSALPGRLTAELVTPAQDEQGLDCYRRPHLHFRLSSDRIRELLMEEKLYGDKALAVRELYQNALDACRYRKARREWLAIHPNGTRAEREPEPWTGRIEFDRGVDTMGRAYIECRDNGVGMGHQHLVDCFAFAGERFATSSEFKQEARDWELSGSGVQMHPNSQFGIGVFSYFMLAAELEVHTRRLNRDGSLGEGLSANIAAGGRIFRVRPSTLLDDAGTAVRLMLRPNATEVSVVDTLRDQLFVAEFEVHAREGRVDATWMPGHLGPAALRQPTSLIRSGAAGRSLRKVRLRSRISVGPSTTFTLAQGGRMQEARVFGSSVSDALPTRVLTTEGSARALSRSNEWPRSVRSGAPFPSSRPEVWWLPNKTGVLLADGIRTSAEAGFAVVDLRHRYRPELSVDRKDIISFDAKHLDDLLAASLPAFAEPPQWLDLQWVWDQPTWIGKRLFEVLAQAGVRLPVARSSDSPALRDGLDLNVLGYFPADAKVVPCVLARRDVTANFPTSLAAARACRLREAGLDSIAGLPPGVDTPTADDWEVLQSFVGRAVTPLDVALVAAKHRRSLQALDAVVHRFAGLLEARLSSENWPAPPDLCLRPEDSALLGGSWSPFELLRWGSPREGLERARPLRAYAGLPFQELNVDSRSLAATELDLQLLSANLDGSGGLVQSPVPAVHVIAGASRHGRPATFVAERLAAHASLCALELVECDWPEAGRGGPPVSDAVLLSLRLDGRPPWVQGSVAVSHILRAAAHLRLESESLRQRLEQLSALLGIEVPPAVPSTPSSDDCLILSRRVDRSTPWIAGRVRLGHILACAAALERTPLEIWDRLDGYAAALKLGLEVGRSAMEGGWELDVDSRLLSRNLDGRDPWLRGPCSARHLLWAASVLERPVSAVHARLTQLATLTDVAVPDCPEPLPAPSIRLLRDGSRWRRRLQWSALLERMSDLSEGMPPLAQRAHELGVEVPLAPARGWGGISDAARRLLSRDMDARAPFLERLTPQHVAVVAAMTGRDAHELLGELVGIVPTADVDNWPDLDEHEVSLALKHGPGRVSPGAIIEASRERHLGLREMARRVLRLAPVFHWELRAIDLDNVPEREGTLLDATLASADLSGTAPWIWAELPARHVDKAAWIVGLTRAEAIEQIRALSVLGLPTK